MKLSEQVWNLSASTSNGVILVLGDKMDFECQRILIIDISQATLIRKAPELLKHIEELIPFLEKNQYHKLKLDEIKTTLTQITL